MSTLRSTLSTLFSGTQSLIKAPAMVLDLTSEFVTEHGDAWKQNKDIREEERAVSRIIRRDSNVLELAKHKDKFSSLIDESGISEMEKLIEEEINSIK